MRAGWYLAIVLGAALLAAAPAPIAAEEPGGEPIVYHPEDPDPAFEEVEPPRINYDDYGGPDPVLEGTPPPSYERPTAGQRRIQEVWDEMAADPEPEAAALEPRSELGTRSFVQAVMALSIVLGLVILSLWAVRRFGVRTPLLAGANLGQVLGRVHLSPKASLHFVRTGGKVLVVGVTQESVQLVETFDAEAFEAALQRGSESKAAASPSPGPTFLDQFREHSDRMREPVAPDTPDDGDIANLRGDIERLQRMLREATRE